MSRPARWALIFIATLLLFLVGSFGLSRGISAGKILGDVKVADASIGGMTPEEAAERLAILEAEIGAIPIDLMVVGQQVTLTPSQVGFQLAIDHLVSDAMARGRTGTIADQFRWWLRHAFSNASLALEGSIDPDATTALLDNWSRTLIANQPFPGAVEVRGSEPVPVYPREGEQIDTGTATGMILGAILGEIPEPVELPIVTKRPEVTEREIDAAVQRARLWLAAPVVLTAERGEISVAFTVGDLASAFRSEVSGREIVFSFDPAVVEEVLMRHQDRIEQPPVDARLEVDGYEVRIVPGRHGTLIDPRATAANLERAASSATRTGTLPFQEGAPPEVTTEELEALGIKHLVASFTTYHDCCQNRVHNIHLFADAVDGAIVQPGDSFGLNAHVGERTSEKGYLLDGTIIQGELVETVGGGVSQFATTFYNAVFWGGYEDITHKPHSFYFSRYPEGIEATISWPLPELEFRNDDDAAILIKTRYTDTSITVEFYGDNDGRILVGDHRNGTTNIEVVAEGGPNARRVTAQVSGRFNFTEPTTEYRANPALAPDEQDQGQKPAPGWTVRVTRVIEEGGVTRTREWTVRYIPRRAIIEVHPCRIPELTGTSDPESQPCPTTTTTTTTTTVPPEGSDSE